MQANSLIKQENGRKPYAIEISVDACAELGGQVYQVISALRNLHQLSQLRTITYVDTYQGLREKSDSTTPETLFAFGEPYSGFGRFLYNNRGWHRITETRECRKFSATLGNDILPTMTAPIFDAVAQITAKIRKEVFAVMQRNGQKTLSGKQVRSASDVEIVTHYSRRGNLHKEHLVVASPLVKEIIHKKLRTWVKLVERNSVLSQAARENKKEEMLIKLIAHTQECKAVAAALLYQKSPSVAMKLGALPPLVTKAHTLPSLATLRDCAHKFGHLDFTRDKKSWRRPEVQQALRYTSLWPWARKPYMREAAHVMLRAAHKNTADRAAVSYFMNNLSRHEGSSDTLYILVTHDGPLITDFIKFVTGIEKKEVKIKDSRMKGVGKLKKTEFTPVSPGEYAARGLLKLTPDRQPYTQIITGTEFVEFIEREQKRVLKKIPMTHELRQALDTLSNQVELLKDVVDRDKQIHGLIKGGTFAQRVRANTSATHAHA